MYHTALPCKKFGFLFTGRYKVVGEGQKEVNKGMRIGEDELL